MGMRTLEWKSGQGECGRVKVWPSIIQKGKSMTKSSQKEKVWPRRDQKDKSKAKGKYCYTVIRESTSAFSNLKREVTITGAKIQFASALFKTECIWKHT